MDRDLENLADLSVILLAAGKSKRLGTPKQLLPFRESTVLEETIKNLTASSLDELIVVSGYQAEEIAGKIKDKQIKVAVNPDFQTGIGSSIRCGLTKVSEKADSVMIVLGDQPLIDKDIINPLVREFTMTERGILVPYYRGVKGHPVIFDRKYLNELFGLPSNIGGRKVIKEHPDDVLNVEVDSENVIVDIDTLDDYKISLEKRRKLD